ncbi:branched-chain-amino-acid aminotransferase-like protein 2 isoform X5 [Asterias rubens]|uniref:branched-chain-amino-acid aminotransferase-like protein 2 isoform X5 n=1 Tax=Asterias rubens TaxID=7604 RepID=UPI0014553A80|nr:branched-chain-amino-acid aminotransferase-like protein 2 isoform X5 [Asterias rubens]
MADSNVNSSEQVRLMTWAVPRSVSTAFTKLMSYVSEDSTVLFEPYINAHWFGPERLQDATHRATVAALKEEADRRITYTGGSDVSDFTFGFVKEQLEAPHTGKKLVFCKDMAFTVVDKLEFLPKDYRHLFLIRHPLKVFASWKKLYQSLTPHEFELDKVVPVLFPPGFFFREVVELLEHVREVHDPKAIIIDADDLLSDPKGILSALFKEVGLPFDEKCLQWEAGDATAEQWMASNFLLKGNRVWGYYSRAFNSSSFGKPADLPDRSSLPDDVLRCTDASMPFYEKVFAQRLLPN